MNPILPPPGPPQPEDIGTRALDDALRASLRILKVLMVLVATLVLFSGIFTVEPNEVALVLRFGRPVGTGTAQVLKPGLHWAFPYPIDEIVRIPAGQSHTVTSSIGWYAVPPELLARGEEPAPRGTLTPGADGYLIAGDGNIFHARATLKYRIHEPWRYAVAFTRVTNLLQSILDNSLLHAAAATTAENAIYRDKSAFRDAVLAAVSDAVAREGLGISLDPFDVQVVAPVDVRPAFEAVLAAEQERSRKVNEARAYAHETTLTAGGQAQALRSAGIAASNQIILAVAGQSAFFAEQLPHYRAQPDLFRRRLLAETVESVVARAQDTFLLPAPGREPHQLRLQLNREPPRARTNHTALP